MSPVRKYVSFSKTIIRVSDILICLYKAQIVFYINHLFSKASEALHSSWVYRRATGNRFLTFRRHILPE